MTRWWGRRPGGENNEKEREMNQVKRRVKKEVKSCIQFAAVKSQMGKRHVSVESPSPG